MIQKHFMDIEHIRESGSNAKGFEQGDIIQISEKWDGSNACAAWDSEQNTMCAFSRKRTLNFSNTLNGFWEYIQSLPESTVKCFKAHPNWRVFGEWGNKNKILYNKECYKKWYVYDIFDVETNKWLPQIRVKSFAKEANLEYINVLYEGAFLSWEHCRKFMNSPAYGESQEGIVIKNQTKLNSEDNHFPFYLKIVNADFKESKAQKVVDLDKLAAKEKATALAKTIITRNRVEKELYKMRDEQLVPAELSPTDLGAIAKILPARIYKDCVKEENEIVVACGEFFGKICGSIAMKHAKDIVMQ